MGAPQFKISKTFWRNEVNWEDKTDDFFFIPRGYKSKLLVTNAIWFCQFYANPTKIVLIEYLTRPDNLPSTSCGWGWPLGIQSNCSYWLFGGHAHIGKFFLDQSTDGGMCLSTIRFWSRVDILLLTAQGTEAMKASYVHRRPSNIYVITYWKQFDLNIDK